MSNQEQKTPRSFATPAVDIFESDQELLVLADLPGVQRSEVQLHFEDTSLVLEATQQDGQHVFRRTFSLSEGLQTERIEAKLEHGVLSVHLPKLAPPKPLEIPVH